VFSKPIKRTIKVPSDDWVWLTSDYSFLEVAIATNITNDSELMRQLSSGFDAHCSNSAIYFKDEIEGILGPNDGSLTWNQKYKAAVETNSTLDKLRSNSKQITFACTYLAAVPGLYRAVGWLKETFSDEIVIKGYMYTTDVKQITLHNGAKLTVGDNNGLWLPVEEYKHLDTKYHEFFEKAVVPAKTMHNAYHNELYTGLRDYRDNVIIKQVKEHKNFHMGCGAYINQTAKFNMGSIRTMNNVSAQGWSWLTLFAFERFRREVEKAGYGNDIKLVNSIYDSVYFLVRKDTNLIKWARDTLVNLMTQDFLKDQKLKLNADVEISTTDWASFVMLDKIDNLEKYLKG